MMSQESPTTSLPKLPSRAPDSHKGNYGRALLIGGSRGMTGAIAMAGMATLRSGAGLVKLGVPACCQAVVAGFEPSYMTSALPSDESGRITGEATDSLKPLVEESTVVAMGPGLSRSEGLDRLVAHLYQTVDKPLVVDADALNALADQPDVLAQPSGPRILTPHPGEFARLATNTEEANRQGAEALAQRCQAVVVLKGHRTLVTDGKQTAVNMTGNPGMATGGSGDVLTGVITGLLCQGLTPWDAARLGVHLHGLAGDLAVEALGEVSLIASDLLELLPLAFQHLE